MMHPLLCVMPLWRVGNQERKRTSKLLVERSASPCHLMKGIGVKSAGVGFSPRGGVVNPLSRVDPGVLS